MGKLFKYLLGFVIVDLFFFSTPFTFSGGVNSKMALAVVGLVFIAFDIRKNHTFYVSQELIGTTLIAAAISLTALSATIINNTSDMTYASYFMSMWVWFSAAYAVVRCIKALHGEVSLRLISVYIVIVSVCQGCLAVWADTNLAVKLFINRWIPGMAWVDAVHRLYGFGATACLDTGGLRFAIASILSCYLLCDCADRGKSRLAPLWLVAFLLIGVTGNMVARTTTVGTVLGLVYLFFKANIFKTTVSTQQFGTMVRLFAVTVLFVILAVFLYNTNDRIHENMRFAFEGFFSLAEEGEWNVSSNNKLKTMYVFPDNPKTWTIGDGYFNNPAGDLGYFGEITDGYYKNTDVGYLRFIFYFGIIGLFFFCALIYYSFRVCLKKYKDNKLLVFAFLVVNFAVWFKVATDSFFIFALLMSIAYVREIMMDSNQKPALKDENHL